MGRVRVSQRWPKDTHRRAVVRFFVMKVLCLSASFYLGQNSHLVFIIFRTSTQSTWSHHPPRRHASCLACHLRNLRGNSAEETPASCLPKEISRHAVVPPPQPIRHPCWGIVLFILGNRCISCHATFAICTMSKESSSGYSTQTNKNKWFEFRFFLLLGGLPYQFVLLFTNCWENNCFNIFPKVISIM